VPLTAQVERQLPDSPVFKRRSITAPPLILPSDALYDLWQAFLVSRKANAGDPVAQQELGVRYLLGRGVEADSTKAAYWFFKAAEQNMISSRFNYGILLYHGWGISWNPFESYRAFLIAAEAGMHEAEFVVGLHYTENLVVPRNYATALEWVRKAADGGYAPAKEALPELERAVAREAQQNASASDSAQSPLALFMEADDDSAAGAALVTSVLAGGDPELRKALGLSSMIEKDIAVDSLRMQGIAAAAQAGSPEALAILGRNYEKGLGVRRDVVLACSYYVRALRMDWPRASQLLSRLVQEPGVISHIRSQAKHNDYEAQYVWVALLGLGYEGLLFKEQSILTPAQAVQMLKAGVDRGHVPSMNELALCYYAGRWVEPDPAEAYRLWTRAADAGSREGMIRRAVVTLRQETDTLARAKAVAVLEQAADDGSILAEMGLAWCYEKGIGMPVRTSDAVRLYRIAARRGSQDAYRALRRLHDALRPTETRYHIDEL
jgi:TPR repeat protein